MRGQVFDFCAQGGSSRKLDPPEVVMSPTAPGYLQLSPEKRDKWISEQPIEDHYEVEDQPFARGKYATVRMCKHKATGQRYAAKFLRKRRRSEDLRPEILHEVAILDACAGSSRIVQLHKVFENSQDMVLLLELAPGGELQMLLDKDEVPEEAQVRRLMRQILDGLAYLHSINIAHLDIKPQNVVLTDEFPHCEAKLCDLGISRYISQGADIRDMLGTPDYVAPEVLNYEPISLATDMWSVGVLLYVLLTGCSPFGGDTKQDTFCNISKCILDFPDDLFEDISDDAKDLMCKLIIKDPSQRLTAEQSLNHKWFSFPDTIVPPSAPITTTCDAEILMARFGEKIQAQRAALAQRVAMIQADGESGDLTEEKRPPLLARRKSLLRSKPDGSKQDAASNQNEKLPALSKEAICTEEEIRSGIGMRSFRKNNFSKNMGNLAEKYAVLTVMDNEISNCQNNNTNKSSPEILDNTQTVTSAKSSVSTDTRNFSRSLASETRTVNRATVVHTMPVGGAVGYQISRSQVQSSPFSNSETKRNLVSLPKTEVIHENLICRRNQDRKDLFHFRKCYIIDDSEDDITTTISPPLSIASDTSSGFCDQSTSDSGSDSISETCGDTSSDRSSIISLDDPVDCSFPKHGNRHYHSQTLRQTNVPWVMDRVKQGTMYSNEKFINSLSRFSSPGENNLRMMSTNAVSQENIFSMKPTKQAAKSSHTTCINEVKLPCLTNSILSSKSKECGLNIVHERKGNIVVLREVKGGKYSRFNEVKCESVQSRIKKFQS